ncbi:MAG: hypothetical protein ACI4O6_07940 [Dysosmobacter sp.]
MDEKYYIFVGCAEGQFEDENHEKRAYANMYVLTPVSTYASDDYRAQGFKAEKLKCISPAVWKDLIPGVFCTLYFNDKKTVMLAQPLDHMISLEP